MKYTSEIIQKVVTSEACLKALERISPIYANAENFLSILNAIFTEVDVLVGYGSLLEKESMPQTADELLYLWEIEYGINRDISLNADERRARVLAKIRAKSSMTPYKLQEIIRSETGVVAYVTENTGKNKFDVRLVANNQSELRHGIQIQSIIDRHKPAHTLCEVRFEIITRDTIHAGGIVRAAKMIELQQIGTVDIPTEPEQGITTSVLGEAVLGEMVLGE